MIVLVQDLIRIQVRSIQQVIPDSSRYDLYVEGGFSQTHCFYNCYPGNFLNILSTPPRYIRASAIGAAMAIHDVWNPLPRQVK